MTDMREAVARMIDPSTWAGLDSYLADVKRKYAKSNAGYDPDKFKDRKSLAIADAILEAVLENPWREHLLSLLRQTREYVTDSLEAHEHTDGRELLTEVDEALSRDAEYCFTKTMQPEIDRRVAEERVKLLERLREPSEGMVEAGDSEEFAMNVETVMVGDRWKRIWQAMLAQFEKENSDG